VLLDLLFGAELVWGRMVERDQLLKDTFQNAWDAGRRPYLVPYGGSNPTGAAAYALAVQELLAQCRQTDLEGCPPDWIVFPSSSGGTQAGLALGARLFDYPGKVLGISVDEEAGVLKTRVARLAAATADFMGERLEFSPDEILVDDGYLGGGYGVLGTAEREAVQLFARLEGLLLDPVYTGRAAAGMIDLIRKGFFKKGETVLFWHTGGTPALFAEKYADIIG
jgi:1-aminocyclopropane-1-carboxylate deaminase/D-cysteine desulfhydrase-like pyridoxal-dependent ACC family enzyme